MAMLRSTAAVTVNVDEPVILPKVARMVEVPIPTPVASPPALISAVPVVPVVHVTLVVRFCVVPFVYLPVAVNCLVRPFAMDGAFGVTPMNTSAIGVTVKMVVPEIVPETAMIVDVPIPIVDTVGRFGLNIATDAFDEENATVDVMFLVVPSL